jgi:dienelactone hydrolase
MLVLLVCLVPQQSAWNTQAAEPEIPAYTPIVRRLPPRGIKISSEDRAMLQTRLAALQAKIAKLPKEKILAASNSATPIDLTADIAIYAKAVELALRFDEFYKPDHVQLAAKLLDAGQQRAERLAQGNADWTRQRGVLVRGYRSRLDGSAQPYGLVIPAELDLSKPVPVYIWLHGRGDKSTDLHFLAERSNRPGQFQPQDGIVLHAFGRQCIGFKSAGEIDIFEALADVARKYPIDRDRVALMGFSMGGAGAWHVGAHYTDRFAVIHPGAGFVDVRRYQNLSDDDLPPWYEQVLWHDYDVPDYVRNLLNVPLVVYSGENDKQKAAADIMEAALAEQGLKMTHLIGPGMGHAYHPEKLKEVLTLVQQAIQSGRPEHPLRVTLQTRTLRYPSMFWVKLLGLIEHWQDTRVDAEVSEDGGTIDVKTVNVRRLQLDFLKSQSKAPPASVQITIDGEKLSAPYARGSVKLVLKDKWQIDKTTLAESAQALSKRPGLQGPIDDVLLEPFLVVTPSGKSAHPQIDRWVDFELDHFLERWRAVYRGEARVKLDKDVTDEDLAKYHVILWGDPSSNLLMKRVVGKLPIAWTADKLQIGAQAFDAAYHVPLLIYPNPLHPDRYVVLNSGCTHREGHDRTNSLQNPKLPDWAVIDIRTPPSDTQPGQVVAADFFDEAWQLKKPRPLK